MRITVLFFLSLLGLFSCSNEPELSESKWAHFNLNNNYGSITARLLYLQKEYSTNFSKVHVCVQGSDDYSRNELLLEVKLAYAAWLEATGEGNETSWNQLEFTTQYMCNYNDRSYGSAVAIASSAKQDSAQHQPEFNQRLCTPSLPNSNYIRFPSYDCNTMSQTLGLGGPGGISLAGKSARSLQPSTATMSPYVAWASLEDDFLAQIKFANADTYTKNKMRMDGFSKPTHVSQENLEHLLANYRSLKEGAGSVRWQQLQTFNRKLAALRYETSSNLNYTISPFASNKYMPIKAAFHTMLHEIGHQFGMAHAHAPEYDNETGSSSAAAQIGEAWVCRDAVMAYDNTYAFLSEDDRRGAATLQQSLAQMLD